MRGPPLNIFSLFHDKEKNWSKRIKKKENQWVESVLWSDDSNNDVHNVLNDNKQGPLGEKTQSRTPVRYTNTTNNNTDLSFIIIDALHALAQCM